MPTLLARHRDAYDRCLAIGILRLLESPLDVEI